MEFTNRKNQAGVVGSSTVAGAGEEIVILPPCNLSMGVTVTASSALDTCTVYTSTSKEEVVFMPGAIWVEWPLGAITLGSDVLVGPVTALKLVANVSEGKFEVVTA